ncbi:MAG: hypothetical protein SF051_10570, partial [Elusimicrobiota bacterium]|nr:hypothetical protein [Elusimicrobiota bacterium]
VAGPAADAPVVVKLGGVSEGVNAALAETGAIAQAPAGSAATLGRRLEDLVLGLRSRASAALAVAPADAPMASPAGSNSLAKPAGDGIRQAAEASADGPSVPTPPSGSDDGGSSPKGNGPLLPRLLASGLALLPAYFFGLPLLAAQGYLVGGLLIVSSVGMALMPLLGPGATKTLRAIPGLALGATSLAGVGVALSLSYGLGVPTAMSLMAPGLFALLGGWGLTRYGVSGPRHRFDKLESVSAFFGGIAALTGIGLAAVGPVTWFGTGLLWLSYPLSMMLWAHLPSWVGEGVKNAFNGLYQGARGAFRVVGATRRDTVIFERLTRFSARMYETWKGNALWLGLLIWGPLLVIEGVMYAAALVSGLAVGLVQVPAMALWGAVHKLRPGSKAAVVAAETARPAFDNVSNGKKAWFNRAEAKLLPSANSSSFIKSALGGLGIRGLQLVWLLAAPFAALGLAVAGPFFGLARGATPYDEARHDPDGLRVTRDDSPGEKPQDPGEDDRPAPGKVPFAAKVFTGLLALAPAVYFGYPLIFEGFSIIRAGLFLAAALPLAASPFLGKGTPFFLRTLAGRALQWNGLFMLVSGHAIVAGLLAALGGWGYMNYMRRLEKDDKERFDEFEVSAFFGTLGAVVAAGAAWVGLAGWPLWTALGFGLLTSPLLLQHLPRWVGAGVRGVFRSFSDSIAAFHEVVSFWYDHDFRRNLSSHASHWLEKHWTHGIWLSLIWVPTWLVYAAEAVLSLALGLAFGLVRAPFYFVARALGEAKPESRLSRFANGLADGWLASAEGSKALFDKVTASLQKVMEAKDAVSGRPTLVAALAFLGARLAQVLWLLGVAVMLPLGFLYGLFNGVKKAFSPAPADPR